MLSIYLPSLILIHLAFTYSIIKERNDIAGVIWGLGIGLMPLSAYILNITNQTVYSALLVFIISVWAIRLVFHIGSRFLTKTEEDYRYKTWRETWKFFYLRSYLQVFILQGLLMSLVSLGSVYYVSNISSLNSDTLNTITLVGSMLALCALIFESKADLELKNFLKDRFVGKVKNKYLTTGLWSLTRHPNYFGEVAFWWCVAIAVSPVAMSGGGIINLILILISPLTITYLILKVSGIPMLEAKNDADPEWEAYKAKTPAFFPKFW